MTPQTGVMIKLQDDQGNIIGEFPGEDNKSIITMAEKHDIEIPCSCCSGACFVCSAKIIKGHDDLQIDKLSVPLVDLDIDDDGRYQEILTCIGGIKSSCFADGKYHEIVLQKLI